MTDHTPWCDHKHPDTDDGTGATPCHSRPVMLWPGAAAWLRSPSYPSDSPAVIVDNRDGTQTTWDLAEFRQMLWAGIELCATANLGTWPAPDPGPAPHGEPVSELERTWREAATPQMIEDAERTQAQIEADADAYARNTISPEFADMLLNRSADAERTAELAAAAIPIVTDITFSMDVEVNPDGLAHMLANLPPTVVDDQPSTPDLLQAPQDSVDRAKAGRPAPAPRQLCTCSFLPDPHILGASCPCPRPAAP